MARIPAFAFPAKACTHLLTPEGWKAELALGLVHTTYCTHYKFSEGKWYHHELPYVLVKLLPEVLYEAYIG